ncbi:MAG: hypothetical protein DWQ31_02425 [Planctomycetota bacterium]|nr:MAG: hypothetical protein DWQ31_02425 [Planctomycetota bacterium]REJ95800.1 MAG: hypothetical protein DWQ35_05985 [Planctomycetota bacterium]REK25374.1 MAG: hypothetical protein DWQ42_11680 [Planctomycetota bacterium]REK43509.1 MAG: hypothetical protein DWQ46_11425 [Planctomycetota bacterium]
MHQRSFEEPGRFADEHAWEVNPYQVGQSDTDIRRTKPTWWMIWVGLASLAFTVVPGAFTYYYAFAPWRAIVESDRAPAPAQLALPVEGTLELVMITLSFAIGGLVLIVVGFLIRRPVESVGDGRRQ